MHGCWHPALAFVVLLAALGASGCEFAHQQQPAESAAPDAGRDFDPTTAGTMYGDVTWSGEPPLVPAFEGSVPATGTARGVKLVRENPNAPRIRAGNGGVADAVIFLRGIDPRRARPWDHLPVRVRQDNYRLKVLQGEADSRRGFVRRGDAIEMVSTQSVPHALRASGADFFTLAFPDSDQPLARRLERRGVVELSSATEYWWMRAYLFVDDHPYYARTDADGTFRLESVPAGDYEIVCWLPSWLRDRHERNPETARVMRWVFCPPVESTQRVALEAGRSRQVRFTLSLKSFAEAHPVPKD